MLRPSLVYLPESEEQEILLQLFIPNIGKRITDVTIPFFSNDLSIYCCVIMYMYVLGTPDAGKQSIPLYVQ